MTNLNKSGPATVLPDDGLVPLESSVAHRTMESLDDARAQHRAAVAQSESAAAVNEALRDGERRFHELIDALPAAVYVTDRDGRLTHANPAAIEVSGRTPQLGTDRWCVSWKMYRRDGVPLPHDECPMAVALREGRAIRDEELIIERPDGTRRWVQPYPTPLRDAEGRVVGGINMVVDITERKRDGEISAWLASIVRSSDDAIISKGLDGVITSWNDSAQRLFGYTAEEAIGRPVTMLIPHDRLDEEPKILERLKRGERVDHFETRRMRKDGTLLDLSLTISPVKDDQGRVIGASKIARDISERKRAEEALRHKEGQLQAESADSKLLQGVNYAITEPTGTQTLYENILDAAVAIMRSDMGSMQIVDEGEDALRLLAFRGFEPEFGKVFELCHPDTKTSCSVARRIGRRVIVPDVEACDFIAGTPALADHRKAGIRAVQSTPLIARSGLVVGMISTHWRRPHEPTQRDLRLLDVLARLAADLIERSQAQKALLDADRRKDEFLAMLGHELRNPLAPIRSSLDVIHNIEIGDDTLRQCIRTIERQSSHMIRLVDDLLEMSRIASGALTVELADVALSDVVARAIDAARPLIVARRHRLRVDQPPQQVRVRGDLVRLTQLVANLLINAARYAPAGSEIGLAVGAGDTEATVTVSDNGEGIARERLARIFEPFALGGEGSRIGLGIGLPLARRLAELHGGTIEAKSGGPGKGSAFTVRLPLLASDWKVATSPAAAAIPDLDGCRVLVVDDNADAAHMLEIFLQTHACEVRCAYDGASAVPLAREFAPDVVLLDLGLPDIDGYEVLRRLRAAAGHKPAVIALTGFSQPADLARMKEAGFDHSLTKPADSRALAARIADLRRKAA